MSHEISPISTAVDVRVLTMGPKVSGFLLGFNLDDEVNVIPNRSQKSIHAKVGAFESAAGFFPTLFTTTLSVTGLEDNAKANRDMAVR
jgi:hypothetical protein